MTRVRTVTPEAPSAWAPVLVNGDASGLEAAEVALLDRWLAEVNLTAPACTGCIPAGFLWSHDASALVGGADCQTCHFLIPA